MPDDPGWVLPDSDPSAVPVVPPQHVQPHPWPPRGPEQAGRRPMPRWAKIVLGIGIAYYAIAVLAVIIGAIVYFAVYAGR